MATPSSHSHEHEPNLETYGLIWLDASVNTSDHNREAQTKFRSIINHLVTFEDYQKCLKYIQSLPKDNRSFFIVSGQFGQRIVLEILHLRCIAAVYIYCFDKTFHEKWTQGYVKIKGVFNQLSELMKRLEFDHKQKEHAKVDEQLVFNILRSSNGLGKATRDLNGEFLHTQLLIECLIRIPSNSGDEKELITLCKRLYEGSPFDLGTVREFQFQYLPEMAVGWYTRESFLYRLLNKALRTEDIHVLYLFRFFIADIRQQLLDNRCSTRIHVYRGQVLSKEEFSWLQESKRKIISVNTFFSTSLDPKRARQFLSTADHTSNTEEVLFDIIADPQIENLAIFGDVSSISSYPHEEEVIFMIGSVFRLKEIIHGDDGVWIVHMTLCSLADEELHDLWKHMRKQLPDGETNLLKLGQILRDMRKLDDAQKYFNRLLKKLPRNDPQLGACYFELGRLANDQRDYHLSLTYYQRALEIKQRTLEKNDRSIASTHGNMANIYREMGNNDQALESYDQAMQTYKENRSDEDLFVASCWNNMGTIYQSKGKHQHALTAYQKALAIREELCVRYHPHIATSHYNIAAIHATLEDNEQAIEHLLQSLDIDQKQCSKHPRILPTVEHLARLYENSYDLEQALIYYRQARTIYRQTNTSTEPTAVKNNQSIQRVLKKLGRPLTDVLDLFEDIS